MDRDLQIEPALQARIIDLINESPLQQNQLLAAFEELQGIEADLRQRNAYERQIGAIAQHIRQSLNLSEILNTTVTEVQQFLQADRVLIYGLQSTPTPRSVAESQSKVELNPTKPQTVLLAESIARREQSVQGLNASALVRAEEAEWLQYQQGQAIAITDVETAELTSSTLALLSEFQIKAQLSVPILQADQLWGLLVVHQCHKARSWQPLEVDLLLQLARQVSIAIQQSQLYQQTQYQAQREQALNRVTQAIRSSLDLDTIFASAAVEIGSLLNADHTQIVQYLPAQGRWLGVADYRKDETSPTLLGLEIPDEGYEVMAQLKRLEIVKIDDVSRHTAQIPFAIARKFPGAWLMVPLHIHGTIWGCLSLILHVSPHTWQDSEVELMCAVANQLAIAIQQAQLYQQVQNLNAQLERQVQERTVKLQQAVEFEAVIKRVTEKVRDSLDEAVILQTVVQELAVLLGVTRCNTALYDLKQVIATIHYESTTASVSLQGKSYRMADFPDIYTPLLDYRCLHFCLRSVPSSAQPTAILACPIFDNQGILGDLWLYRQGHSSFDELEVRLVQQVANQCAIAIRQARLYQTAQTQVQELQKLNHLKDDFLSTLSHELRTPLASIKMAAQVLEDVLRSALSAPNVLSEAHRGKVERYLKILNEQCEREIHLVNDLLTIQELEAGTHTLVPIPIQLQVWVPQVLELFEEQTQNAQQRLSMLIQPDLPPLIADLFMLDRILEELLNNACKFSPAGAEIRVAIALGVSRPEPMGVGAEPTRLEPAQVVEISVSNTGVEISADEMPRIFDKFYRIPSQDPWKQKGTGLGLALVKRLATYLGGQVWAESAANETRFTVQLPLVCRQTIS